MKDKLGNDIKLGDYILYTSRFWGIRVGRVISMKQKAGYDFSPLSSTLGIITERFGMVLKATVLRPENAVVAHESMIPLYIKDKLRANTHY